MNNKIYLGTTTDKPFLFHDLNNILICGVVGSGKSFALNNIILNKQKISTNLKLLLADGNHVGNDFKPEVKALTQYPLAGFNPESKIQDLETLLNVAIDEIEKRKKQYQEENQRDFDPILLVIEDLRHFEFNNTESALNSPKSIAHKLNKVLTQGRTYNIATIITTQDYRTLPSYITSKAPYKLIFQQLPAVSEYIFPNSDKLHLGQYHLYTPDKGEPVLAVALEYKDIADKLLQQIPLIIKDLNPFEEINEHLENLLKEIK